MTADIYVFGELDHCMVIDCECPLRPWRTKIEAKDGNFVAYFCPCHFLMAFGTVAHIRTLDANLPESPSP
jgi:hypothetical protein